MLISDYYSISWKHVNLTLKKLKYKITYRLAWQNSVRVKLTALKLHVSAFELQNFFHEKSSFHGKTAIKYNYLNVNIANMSIKTFVRNSIKVLIHFYNYIVNINIFRIPNTIFEIYKNPKWKMLSLIVRTIKVLENFITYCSQGITYRD